VLESCLLRIGGVLTQETRPSFMCYLAEPGCSALKGIGINRKHQELGLNGAMPIWIVGTADNKKHAHPLCYLDARGGSTLKGVDVEKNPRMGALGLCPLRWVWLTHC